MPVANTETEIQNTAESDKNVIAAVAKVNRNVEYNTTPTMVAHRTHCMSAASGRSRIICGALFVVFF